MQTYDWVKPDEVAAPWRPLTTAETERAQALIDSASRDIVRRWPLVPARIEAGTLDVRDVADVITWLVLPVLGGPPVPGAKAWQVTSGSESRSLTLDAAGNPRDPWVYASWMVAILDGAGAAPAPVPLGSFPRAGDRMDRLFPDSTEEY